VKFAVTYSTAWKAVKKTANAIVKTSAQTASTLLPAVIAWWLYVTVAPELSRINVFNNGIALGSNAAIPFGGQMLPISIVGAKLAAKNAQKNAKKNITSETINKIIP